MLFIQEIPNKGSNIVHYLSFLTTKKSANFLFKHSITKYDILRQEQKQYFLLGIIHGIVIKKY